MGLKAQKELGPNTGPGKQKLDLDTTLSLSLDSLSLFTLKYIYWLINVVSFKIIESKSPQDAILF